MHPGASRVHRLYTGVSDARPAYLRVSFRKRSGRSVVMKSTRFSMAHIMSAGLFTVQTFEAADRGYDSNKLLDYVYARGGEPTIPSRKGAKFERHCDWWLYKERHLVEKYFLKLKAFRRIATRYDKLALRDMVQNHLIQLVALTALEPPAVFNADNFRNEVVKVYESLAPLKEEDLEEHIVRGQYTASGSKAGYREEKNVAPNSRTETYIAMKIGINNWRWKGVPFYIRTGKQMPTKVTEIVVHFRETPHQMFRCEGGHCPRANKLILRLQPNEGIVLKFGMKTPGPGFDVKQVMMDFSYDQLGGLPTGDAYARLIEDCIQGDPTLFTRSDAVEASWRFFDPVLRYWKEHTDAPLYGYPVGTWGPLESEAMMHEHGAEWTNPCKNLTNTDEYCEL